MSCHAGGCDQRWEAVLGDRRGGRGADGAVRSGGVHLPAQRAADPDPGRGDDPGARARAGGDGRDGARRPGHGAVRPAARAARAGRAGRSALWARLPGARLLAWTPDGRLLVSRPAAGDVVALTPGAGQPRADDARRRPDPAARPRLRRRHALRRRERPGRRLPLRRRRGRPAPRSSSPGCPTRRARSCTGPTRTRSRAWRWAPTARSTSRSAPRATSPRRTATPTRSAPRSCGYTGWRRARGLRPRGAQRHRARRRPDGAVWTAVNNRDNIAYPYDRDYDGDGASDLGEVLQAT